MLYDIAFGFLSGVLAFNGAPHLIKGLVRERHPCLLGNSPITNLVAGWFLIVLAVACADASHLADSWPAQIAAAVGGLAIGLFHAGPGAIGRSEPDGGAGEMPGE